MFIYDLNGRGMPQILRLCSSDGDSGHTGQLNTGSSLDFVFVSGYPLGLAWTLGGVTVHLK